MRDSERSSIYHRSRHSTRSKSRDRERTRERYHGRDRDRSSRDRDRDYDRENYSRRYKAKSKKSKRSKKSKHRRRSSSNSSTSSTSSRESRSSHSSRTSKYSSKVRAPSSESNSRGAITSSSANTTISVAKAIDLMDFKVQKSLETIEEDTFVPRTFFSTRDREAPEKNTLSSDKVIIDLQSDIVTYPTSLEKLKDVNNKEEMFHQNFLGDCEQKQDKWVRKLFLYRQKYMTE